MKKGFTMIELIFVIVILGILASVAIPRLAATREDAEISATVANLRTLVSDVTAYYTAKGEFPTSTKWNEITNVPLSDGTKPALNAGAKLKAGGGECISVQMFEKNGAIPAHILITKDTVVNNVCKQVLASEPLKAYFSSTVAGVTNNDSSKGYIAIGSSTSVYTTPTQ